MFSEKRKKQLLYKRALNYYHGHLDKMITAADKTPLNYPDGYIDHLKEERTKAKTEYDNLVMELFDKKLFEQCAKENF